MHGRLPQSRRKRESAVAPIVGARAAARPRRAVRHNRAMSGAVPDDRVTAGLAALDRHAWRESYDLLKAADADGVLRGPELEQLGLAAWWLGRLDDSLETMERAYEARTAERDHQAAAHVALELARGYAWKSARSMAMGWLARAVHL